MSEKPKVGDVLFRAEARTPAQWELGVKVRIAYTRWRVEAVTPCGLWLADAAMLRLAVGALGRFWRKWPGVFAWPTEAEALASLKRRSRRRHQFALRRLREAELVLEALNVAVPAPRELLRSGSSWGITR